MKKDCSIYFFAHLYFGLAPAIICLVFLSFPTRLRAQVTTLMPPVDAPAPAATISQDDQIAVAIYKAFYYDPRIPSALTYVMVTNGVATLTGSVPSIESSRAAEDLAGKIPGVTQVVNWLEIRGPQPEHPDEEIYRNIRHAIGTDPQVNRYVVQVGVLNGRVYLAGPVDTVFARAKIANLAAEVPGVIRVENGLTVSQGHYLYDDGSPGGSYPHTKRLDDHHLESLVRNLMQSSPLVDSRQVKMQVKDGAVTLCGTVASESERNAAVHNAYAAGAREVRDQLQVDSTLYANQQVLK